MCGWDFEASKCEVGAVTGSEEREQLYEAYPGGCSHHTPGPSPHQDPAEDNTRNPDQELLDQVELWHILGILGLVLATQGLHACCAADQGTVAASRSPGAGMEASNWYHCLTVPSLYHCLTADPIKSP